ncbi:MAG: PHB depolymerase family esterase [Sporichthyaceae bacterium]|nr:PHB depolymerase family esterase [Sporichthyaceae bacterium]
MSGERVHDMEEATRLTRAGRLAEATSLIQRTLGRDGSPVAPASPTTPVPAPALAAAEPAGAFLDGAFSAAAGGLRYKLYVPSANAGAPRPLVVMLHGGTQGAEDFATGTQMNVLAEQQDFLVAYPEQSAAANRMKYWNWFRPADQGRGGEPALIAGITQGVIREYAADPDQVYVAGFSAGGAMAAVMAAAYPDIYAAAGVHSGLAFGAAHDVPSAFHVMKNGPARDARLPGEAIPLIVFHGDRDQTVDRVNAHRLLEQWRSAAEPGPADAGPPTEIRATVPGGRSFTQTVYPDGRGDRVMEQWVVHGAGHAWSGGDTRGSYTDPLGPAASAEMSRFFRSHPRRRR